MITCIREVRLAKGLTLHDVAARCVPPTTAQTVGRLETGMRTVSVAWLNRIADALGVTAADLVQLPERSDLPVAAVLGADGARAPTRSAVLIPPVPASGTVAIKVDASVGEYRAGDQIWCDRLSQDDYASAVNRDVLVPRAAGRFVFGRLVGREQGRLHIISLGSGGRQMVVTDPPWLAVAVRLVRLL